MTIRPPQRPIGPTNTGPRVNRNIRVPQVRLIDEEGQQVGIVPTARALEMAMERNLDLVEVAPNAVPPVCKILDFGRFKYEQSKHDRETRKNQHIVELKELRLRPKTDDHDLEVRVRAARRFLEEGHKVKLLVRFRGREHAHPEVAAKQMDWIISRLNDIAVVERPPILEGRAMLAILARAGSGQGRGGSQPAAQPAAAQTATTAQPSTSPQPAAS
ncbi:MAG TPA: translation initiation factor IF-3, partial [Dehalococcoidia bacterium]|nr:translation initiation factor IF-3 [Dehalococcoidia bacterium]